MSTAKPSAMRGALEWLGFLTPRRVAVAAHAHDAAGGHGHTHGVVDASITTSARGIWAIKWSFIILAITAALQFAVVLVSGSVALFADTIHNVGDAATAIPLWIAFAFARRKPSARFTYGLGRVEDFAGITVVLIILASALVAGYEAIDRLLHPQAIRMLPWVAVAGVIGFLGNEIVAVFRIRIGREIESAALIADGYHARTDGLTSLAVVAGAVGVWLGFPLADPIIGLLITVAIFGIVWQSVKAVMIRALDGVDPSVVEEIRHAATHVADIRQVMDVRARWIGHRLTAELDVGIDPRATVRDADKIAGELEHVLVDHLPALRSVRVRVREFDPDTQAIAAPLHAHAHAAPEPVRLSGALASGLIEIIDTPEGERFRFTTSNAPAGLEATVTIFRPDAPEILELTVREAGKFESRQAPAEPHEFRAELRLRLGERKETLPFAMAEPHGHAH